MDEEYPKRDCEFFDDYLGVCGFPSSHLRSCQKRICPKENEVKT